MLEVQQKAFGKRCCQDHRSGHLHKQNQHAIGKERKRRELLGHRKRLVEVVVKSKV